MKKHDVPETMRAMAIDRFGGPEVLQMHTMPVPKINAQEVLIELDTVGVGMWDARAREGAWGERDFPMVPGTDGSGIVAAVGSRVTRLSVGDRVYSYSYDNPKGGFYAEYVAVSAAKAAPIPGNIDLRDAGGFATIGLTALQGVDDALGIEPGEHVVIHGASGNVGMLALQFARLRKARVLAVASGADGVKFVRRLGAHDAIDGRETDDITAAVRRFAPDGADAVLAFAGGRELTRCLDGLRKGGRVAYPNGVEPEPRRRKGIKFSSYDATPGPREFEHLNRAIEEGRIKLPIAKTFKLRKAADAHHFIERGHVLGKVVLRVK